MKTIDLTHLIFPGMPVYPGTEPPIFQQANTLDEHGFIEKKITMFSHTGTHMDAPGHLFTEGLTLDQLAADHFIGRALVLQVKDVKQREIQLAHLLQYQEQLEQLDYLLFNTGWSRYWGDKQYFTKYPVLSEEAAMWLAKRFKLKGIGLDTISIDHEEASSLPIHRIFMERGLVIIENLTNLDLLPKEQITFSCLPLKIAGADGSPVRAVAMVAENAKESSQGY